MGAHVSEGDGRVGHRADPGAARERQAHRSGDWEAQAVQLADPAGVCQASAPNVTEVRPILYLHGLSSGDFGPALRDRLRRGCLSAVGELDRVADRGVAG